MSKDSANNTPAEVIIKRVLAFCLACLKWAAGVVAASSVAFLLYQGKDPFIIITAWGGYGALRDLMIASAAIVGLAIAAKRVLALDSQAKTAEKRLLNEQFANAVELMAKETTGEKPKPAIAARTGGIYILADLAMKKPAEFAEQVVKNLIAYIKDNTRLTAQPPPEESKTPAKPRKLGGDVQAAFFALHDILSGERTQKSIPNKILDFSYQDFSGLDLSGLDLQHYRKWTETDFRRCKLTGAHFKDADMRGADFSNANLRGATLESVVMNSAIMKEANLTKAIMPKINLSRIDLRGACLSMANLQSANLLGARMHGAMMHKIHLNKIGDSAPADLSYANLYGADLTNAELQGANIKQAWLWGVDLTDAILRDTNLEGANFRGACMVNAKMGKNELTDSVKSAMNGMIMHNGKGELAAEIKECPNDFDWGLWGYEDSYALNGVLDNFARRGDNLSGGLALRMQAREMRNNGEISSYWRGWLENINPETGEYEYSEEDMPF